MQMRFVFLMLMLLMTDAAWGDPNIGVFFKFCAYAPTDKYHDGTYTIQPATVSNANTDYIGGWEHLISGEPKIAVTLNDVSGQYQNNLTGGGKINLNGQPRWFALSMQ